MPLLGRRRLRREPRLPDEVRESLGLRLRERVLATARLADGGWLVATPESLVGEALRLEWTGVAHAQWLDEERVLLVDPVPGAFEAQRLHLVEAGRLPETVHERVVASIVVARRVTVPGGAGARVVGRRAADGTLIWQVLPDSAADAEDERVDAAAAVMVRRLRGELGEPP